MCRKYDFELDPVVLVDGEIGLYRDSFTRAHKRRNSNFKMVVMPLSLAVSKVAIPVFIRGFCTNSPTEEAVMGFSYLMPKEKGMIALEIVYSVRRPADEQAFLANLGATFVPNALFKVENLTSHRIGAHYP